MIQFIHPHDNSEVPMVAVLRNPEASDVRQVDLNLNVQILLNGEFYSQRLGAPIETLTLEFREIDGNQQLAIMGLFLRAQETNKWIRYIDYNGKVWVGKFIDDYLNLDRVLRFTDTNLCKFWNLRLTFKGYLQHARAIFDSTINVSGLATYTTVP